jgi:maltose alpha-D-glucosyltransferase/alpha-amylase
MKNFFDCQPAINYGFAKPLYEWEQTVNSPAAIASRQELFHIMDFWMSRGADGFRVDMASSLIKRDEDFKETGKLWAEIKTKFQQKYPEGVLISEWGNPEQAVRAGFMIDFMIHFGVKGYPSLFFNQEGVFKRKDCYFSAEGNGSPVEFVENYMSQLKAVSSNGYVSVPTSNHDIQRPFSGTRNTEEQLKVVMTFILTLKGMPFIYYGDEIGMRFVSGLQDKEGSQLEGVSEDGVALGNRAGTRTPMQWNRGTNAGFSTCNKSQLYLPIDPQATNNNVEDQNKNQASLLNLTRKLIKLRKENNALGNTGDIKFIYAKENSYPLVYTRKSGKSQFLIVVNPSGKEAVAKINIEKKLTLTPILNESVDINIINKSMVINSKKFSYCIYKISGSIF